MPPDPTTASPRITLTTCADEPIHIPGRIQPHGVLLVLDDPGLTIRQVSANVESLLQIPVDQAIDQDFLALVEPSQREEVGRWLLGPDVEEFNPTPVSLRLGGDGGVRTFDASAHRRRGPLIVELENPRTSRGGERGFDVRRSMGRLEAAGSLREFCRIAVSETRALTGFERVLVYRFDLDWHGEVYAESCDDKLSPLMGLHFPASDIPAQARRLYCLNRSRLIADVDQEPSPILPAGGEPIDLSFAALRAASPIHIQYLKNMGTKTSMSFSLMRDERLWGLLSCMHYSEPRYLPPTIRNACEFLAALVSVQLAVKEDGEGFEYRSKLQAVRERLLQRMASENDLAKALLDDSDDLLVLAGAQGAAVVEGDLCQVVGETPEPAWILDLVAWLRRNAPGDVYQTDSLPKHYPEAEACKNRACGLLAATTSREQGRYVLWFRPEVLQTVSWGGNPDKSEDPIQSLTPRTSFESWKEEVHLRSTPWHPAEVDAVRALRDAIIAVVVRRAEELTRLNAELERSNNDLDAFAFSTSHDMKEPLRGIHNYATFLMEDYGEQLDAEGVSRLESLVRLSQRMEDLVESMLQYSRLGRAELHCDDVDLNGVVADVLDTLRPLLEENRATATLPRPLPTVRCDRTQIGQLLINLVTNAVKYNEKPSKSIEIGWRERGEDDGPASPIIYVQDDGIGIPEKHWSTVFRLFKRLHTRDKFGGGTGAGLTFCKKIVERHGGAIWIESEIGRGSTFCFTLGG